MIRDAVMENENIGANSRDIQKLKEMFPQCFDVVGNFSMETFKGILKKEINIRDEGYELNFLGKNYARMLASLETTTVIQPDEEHNNKPENKDSKNIYISGDNLDALKHMLKSYESAVKCIYIDPPYNTGSDGFIYKDKFTFTVESLMEKLNISESEAERLMSMTSRGSASHSAWLTFMYPRLLLARDLLSKDGVIFISIDDNEQANLKLLCDSVFGEENFIATFTRITKKGGKSSDVVALNHDYVNVYSKSAEIKLYPVKHNDKGFKHKDEFFEERGYYKLNQTLDYDSLQYSPSLDYPIEIEGETFYAGSSKEDYEERQNGIYDTADWAWRWSKEKFKFGYENGFIVIKKSRNGKRIYTKTYQKATIDENDDGYFIDYSDRTKCLSTLALTETIYSNDNATKDLNNVFDKKMFDHPKPIELMKQFIQISTSDNDIVLDFFGGSSSTAEAVLRTNIQDGTNRQIIIVQLPELLKDNTSAYKAGFRTIDQIGQERIIRAAKKLREENPDTTADLGFKHYTLQDFDDSFIDKLDEWYEKLNSPQEILLDEEDHMLNRFGLSTVLTTYLVHDGYGFMPEVQELDLAGYTAYHCGNHLYLIREGFGEEQMKALYGALDTDNGFMAEHIVVFGYSFTFTASQMLRDNLFKVKDSAGINKTINIDVRY